MTAHAAIRPATADDIPRLTAGLRALTDQLGVGFAGSSDSLAAACFGPSPVCAALLAEAGDDLAGLSLCSPLYSTVQGQPGAFVSDLWIAAPWRGRGLGAGLLDATAVEAARRWGAGFLRLTVYGSNPRARLFYERLGFTHAAQDQTMQLDGAGFDTAIGRAP
jgi:GNAT superfamily N-acetyltransferase